MPKEILIRHPITQRVPETPYVTAAFEWKCRSCGETLPDKENMESPVICACLDIMDLTPVKKDYHGGK